MKKWHLTLIIWAWFFHFQHPAMTPGALVSGRVGPFANEASCQFEAAMLLAVEFPGLKVSKCVDERDA